MKSKRAVAWIGGALLALTATIAAVASEKREREPEYRSSVQVDRDLEDVAALARLARITLDDAKRIAGREGTVREIELENDDGNLVYSVDVTSARGPLEIIVDAGNGQILGSSADHDEKRSEEDEEAAGDADRDG